MKRSREQYGDDDVVNEKGLVKLLWDNWKRRCRHSAREVAGGSNVAWRLLRSEWGLLPANLPTSRQVPKWSKRQISIALPRRERSL